MGKLLAPQDIAPKAPPAPLQSEPSKVNPFWPATASSLFKDDPTNPASFSNVERLIRKKPIEWGALFDDTGKAKVVMTANSENSIPIIPEMVQLMRNMKGKAIFTHNHPQNSSFSMDDVNLFIGCTMNEIRIVSERYVYSLSDPTFSFHKNTITEDFQHLPGWDLKGIQKQFTDDLNSDELKRLFVEYDIDGKSRMMAMVLGTSVEQEQHIIITDLINRRLFTKWGLNYTVYHIEGEYALDPVF